MEPSQPQWPRYWLMTDERIGARLWDAIEALPSGRGGIVLRHYHLAREDRLALGRDVAQAAAQRDLLLAVAGDARLAERLGAALLHQPAAPEPMPFSRAVHDEQQAEAARVEGAALVFVSPVFATRSHPQAAPLGMERAARLARLAARPAIALGGMNQVQFDALDAAFPGAFHGFAGIDCWLDERPRT